MNTTKRVQALAGLLPSRTAPAEFQLWSVGPNATDYGTHIWSSRSVREVMARYKTRGNPLLLDVEHNGATKDGEPAVTAGYARLEVRAGAPWLVFEWSDYGREQIATGQRRFLSGEYDVDKNTGEILALYRVSLVADPGTHRARMLAAASGKGTNMMNEDNDEVRAARLAGVARVLGVDDPRDEEAIRKAFEALFGQTSGIAAQALRRLTERELQKCKARGVDPAKYAAVKAAAMGR